MQISPGKHIRTFFDVAAKGTLQSSVSSGNSMCDKPITALMMLVALSIFLGPTFDLCAALPIENVTIQGVLVDRELRLSPEKSFHYEETRISFESHVSGCRWIIKLGTHNPDIYDSRIISSDGEEVYLLLNYETRIRNAKAQGRTLPDNIGDGTVASGNLPRFLVANEAGAVWMAFASGCVFSKNANRSETEVPFSAYVRQDPITPDQPLARQQLHSVIDESSGIVIKAVFYLTNLSAQGYYSSPPSFASGRAFTNIVYELISFTNVGGIQLPLEAITSLYRPDLRKTPAISPQLCSQFRLVATNVIIGTKLDTFKPDLPGKTLITDQRFNNGTNFGFAYYQTNDWVNSEVAKASKAYKQAEGQHERKLAMQPAKTPRPRWFARVLILSAFVILPLVAWCAWRRSSRR